MIPSEHFGGKGRSLFFLHANGYPPGCYRTFLERLAEQYSVEAMLQRPLWEGSEPEEIEDWQPLSSDLIRFLDEHRAIPALVLGHSLGAIVALRAALRHPEFFDAIILIEPVLMLPEQISEWKALREAGELRQHPLLVQTRSRRQEFDDLDRIFHAYRDRNIFRYLDDNALRLYIKSITYCAADGRYRLRFSREWEERIYYTGIWQDLDIWENLPSLRVPALIIRGSETDTFLEAQAERMQGILPEIRSEVVEKSSHLVPMEKPHEVADLIFDFLSKQGI